MGRKSGDKPLVSAADFSEWLLPHLEADSRGYIPDMHWGDQKAGPYAGLLRYVADSLGSQPDTVRRALSRAQHEALSIDLTYVEAVFAYYGEYMDLPVFPGNPNTAYEMVRVNAQLHGYNHHPPYLKRRARLLLRFAHGYLEARAPDEVKARITETNNKRVLRKRLRPMPVVQGEEQTREAPCPTGSSPSPPSRPRAGRRTVAAPGPATA